MRFILASGVFVNWDEVESFAYWDEFEDSSHGEAQPYLVINFKGGNTIHLHGKKADELFRCLRDFAGRMQRLYG